MSESEVTPASVHRIECSVDWPPGHVAAYLLDCEEPILFDAGMAGEEAGEELDAALADAGRERADIEHLVVTHPHTDHVGQVPEILDAAAPTVYAPETVEQRFQRDPADLGETVRRNAQAAGVQGSYLEEAVEMSVESLERDSTLLPSEAVDEWLDLGGTVDIGPYTFETVHTPGHQADHLCFRTDVDGESVLFSGDMALTVFRPVAMHTGFDDGYEEAIDAFYTALDRLADLDVDRVFPGHGPVHTEFESAVADDRESLDRLLSRTREELSTESATSALELAFQRAGDRDIRYLVIETASALAKLERDGEVVGETDDAGVRQYRLT